MKWMDRWKAFRKDTKLPPPMLKGDEHVHAHPWNSGPVGAIGHTGPVGPAGPQHVTVGPVGSGPTTVTLAPQQPEAMISISAPDLDSIVIEANGTIIMEAWDTQEAMVDRPVGALGFADGVAYIMTRDGWVNMGIALEKPLEMTDRRGAIRAQKERNRG